MSIDLTKTLRKALTELQTERKKIDSQIAMIQGVLGDGARSLRRRARRPAKAGKRARKPMSAAQRKALSRRMKSNWKKRKAEAAKAKEKSRK